MIQYHFNKKFKKFGIDRVFLSLSNLTFTFRCIFKRFKWTVFCFDNAYNEIIISLDNLDLDDLTLSSETADYNITDELEQDGYCLLLSENLPFVFRKKHFALKFNYETFDNLH